MLHSQPYSWSGRCHLQTGDIWLVPMYILRALSCRRAPCATRGHSQMPAPWEGCQLSMHADGTGISLHIPCFALNAVSCRSLAPKRAVVSVLRNKSMMQRDTVLILITDSKVSQELPPECRRCELRSKPGELAPSSAGKFHP